MIFQYFINPLYGYVQYINIHQKYLKHVPVFQAEEYDFHELLLS